jgi:hypothetical protein
MEDKTTKEKTTKEKIMKERNTPATTTKMTIMMTKTKEKKMRTKESCSGHW